MLNNLIKIKITGKNIDRYINKLYNLKIDILDLNHISKTEVIIKINLSDYKKIKKIKSIYEYNLIDIYGIIKLKNLIKLNRFIFLFTSFGIIIILLLSNMIFNVEISTDNKEMKSLIINEMKSNNIYKYSIKKDYEKLNKISNNIKNKNLNKIEWISIKNIGTKYIVNFLERKANKKEELIQNRNVVAKKNGVIKKIISSKGVVIKNINDYVNRGEIIISGEIKNNEEIKDIVGASGSVYAEVWYLANVVYPYVNIKEVKTNEFSKKLNFKFIDNYIWKSKYSSYLRDDLVLYKNLLLPISIVINKDRKTIKNDIVNLPEEVIEKAYNLSIKKILEGLDKNEYIISKKKLNYFVKDSTIELEVFFKVYENITDYFIINN